MKFDKFLGAISQSQSGLQRQAVYQAKRKQLVRED